MLNKYDKRIYTRWKSMMKRCYNKTDKNYKLYGGRGIWVCNDWKLFKNFKAWVYETCPDIELTMDRINRDEGYYPINVQWISMEENSKKAAHVFKYELPVGTGRRKLSIEDIIYIHSNPHTSSAELARQLDVRRSTIWNVRAGVTWPELHPLLKNKDIKFSRIQKKRVTVLR